ncbi:hypothetical protein OAO01_03705 [Oligoflexia bacterium]|nr:hypothetical protein [Oligoflexia bacterium]
MSWSSPFIVYRAVENGALEEVYYAKDLKKAKYWLTYIGQPGDVLCKTPAHSRHDKDVPEYWSHKDTSGTCTDKDAWVKMVAERSCSLDFPTEEIGSASVSE